MRNKNLLSLACSIISLLCATVVLILTMNKQDSLKSLQEENKALKEYYHASETLLHSLRIDVDDSISSTNTGAKYLEAYDNVTRTVKWQ